MANKIWRQYRGNQLIPNSVLSGEWWQVLGVDQNSPAEEVKRAYRQLARQHHPDLNPSANAKANIQAIIEAYQKFEQR